MRSFGPNISIDGSDHRAFGHTSRTNQPPEANSYESYILGLLEQMNQRATGTLILGAIASNQDHEVTIVPSPSPVDTGAGSLTRSSSVRIAFPAGESGVSPQLGGGGQTDEALLHQVVYALRLIQGGFEPVPMRSGFDNREEFFAILITNIYSSEDQRPVRRDQHGFRIWNPGSGAASRYCLDSLGGMDALRREGSGLGLPLFVGLSRVNSSFNPIRNHLEEGSPGIGQKADAWARDQIRAPAPPTAAAKSAPNGNAAGRYMFFD